MQGWQSPYLGLRDIPSEFTEFDLQVFSASVEPSSS